MSFSKKNRFSLQIIFLFLPFKIDKITLDPDPNWAKILDPDPKTKFNVCFLSTTLQQGPPGLVRALRHSVSLQALL